MLMKSRGDARRARQVDRPHDARVHALAAQLVVARRVDRVEAEDDLVEMIEQSGRSANCRPLVTTAVTMPACCAAAQRVRKSWRSVGSPPWNLIRMVPSRPGRDDLEPLRGRHQLGLHVRAAAVDAAQVAGVEQGGLHLEGMQGGEAVAQEAAGEAQLITARHVARSTASGPQSVDVGRIGATTDPQMSTEPHRLPPPMNTDPFRPPRHHLVERKGGASC